MLISIHLCFLCILYIHIFLNSIVLDGNPLRSIRRSLLTQSTADLKKYLRTRGGEPEYIKAQESAYNFADITPFDERLREMRLVVYVMCFTMLYTLLCCVMLRYDIMLLYMLYMYLI